MAKVILDAGHGGSDAGVSFWNRIEKDEALRLTLAIGDILTQEGVDVSYTRVNDIYNTPYEKAMIANNSGADMFVSIHRNTAEVPNSASGVTSLVYSDDGMKAKLGRNINQKLSEVGYQNLGLVTRPNLVILRRTSMPAVMVELGYINSDQDNNLFDKYFDETAKAVADGILMTWEESGMQDLEAFSLENGDNMMYEERLYSNEVRRPDGQRDNDRQGDNRDRDRDRPGDNNRPGGNDRPGNNNRPGGNDRPGNDHRPGGNDWNRPGGNDRNRPGGNDRNRPGNWDNNHRPGNGGNNNQYRPTYRVQVGAFRDYQNALNYLNQMNQRGFPGFIMEDNGVYRVQLGSYSVLSNALQLEQQLKNLGLNTVIIGNM